MQRTPESFWPLPTVIVWNAAFQLKEMVRKSCHFSDILITETGGISTVYANDGGIVVAY